MKYCLSFFEQCQSWWPLPIYCVSSSPSRLLHAIKLELVTSVVACLEQRENFLVVYLIIGQLFLSSCNPMQSFS